MLAAGASTRMGYPKQTIVLDGKPLVSLVAEAALDAGAARVIVVLGAHANETRAALPRTARIDAIVNPDWASGLASSLTTGLRAAVEDEACDGVLVTLADQPLVHAAALRRLIGAFQAGARLVASGYQGAPGVPALFGREHVPALLGLSGDAGAGAWLRSRTQDVTIVPLDDEVLDLDTPADVARLADRPRSS